MSKSFQKLSTLSIFISVFVLVPSVLASQTQNEKTQNNKTEQLTSIRFADYNSKEQMSNTQSKNLLLESYKLKDFSYTNQPLELKKSSDKKQFLSREIGPLSLAVNFNPLRMRNTGMTFNLDLIKSRDWLRNQENKKLPNISEAFQYEFRKLRSVPNQVKKFKQQLAKELREDHR